MEDLNKLGNVELLNCFLTMHYLIFGFLDDEFDMRITEPNDVSNKYLATLLQIPLTKLVYNLSQVKLNTNVNLNDCYFALLLESINRGLKVENNMPNKNLIYTESFREWYLFMKNTPTYIREIFSTNFKGGYDISFACDTVIGFDYPVREACKILNEKGYNTFWSSANIDDYYMRKDHVVTGISAAYILIDYQNLSTELKEELSLNGECDFRGGALNYSDNDKYYGIWAEITSPNVKCEDLSNILIDKALKLPTLINAYRKA